jgi:hypothetical protein
VAVRANALRVTGGIGAIIGYGCLGAFLYLISLQIYRWFRDGEWTHIGINDGVRISLQHCCVKDGDSGRLSAFLQWLDAPLDWLGVHRVFEVVPASLALFLVSIVGNALFIYCRDRLAKR